MYILNNLMNNPKKYRIKTQNIDKNKGDKETNININNDIINTWETSYNQTIYVSVIIISVCFVILFLDHNDTNFSKVRLYAFKFGYFFAFITFLINMFVIVSINKHTTNVFDILSGSNKSQKNQDIEKQQMQAYAYHSERFHFMRNIRHLFNGSLIILILAVLCVVIGKHKTIDLHFSLILGGFAVITIYIIIRLFLLA